MAASFISVLVQSGYSFHRTPTGTGMWHGDREIDEEPCPSLDLVFGKDSAKILLPRPIGSPREE